MTLETEILQSISRITSEVPAFSWGVEQVNSLLRSRAGATVLVVETGAEGAGPALMQGEEVQAFLAGSEPQKLLYAVPLVDRGREIGRLVAGFGNPVLPTSETRRIAEFAGEQLGGLLGRTHLRAHGGALRTELKRLKGDLAHSKLLARAEGLLTSRHGLSASEARNWLAENARKSGRPLAEVAERLVTYHINAGRLTA